MIHTGYPRLQRHLLAATRMLVDDVQQHADDPDYVHRALSSIRALLAELHTFVHPDAHKAAGGTPYVLQQDADGQTMLLPTESPAVDAVRS